MLNLLRLFIFSTIIGVSLSTHAETQSPFLIANYNPIPQIVGLPTMPDLSQFDSDNKRRLSWGVYADFTNFFAATANSREVCIIDGESYRYSAHLSLRLGEKSLLQFKFPYNIYFGGGMDAGIESWHTTFSLPEGGRQEYPRDLLRFYYKRDNRVLFDYQKSSKGALDSSLRYVYRLSSRNKSLINSFFLHVEFPNGDKSEWRGNGHSDIAMGWATAQRLNFFTHASTYYYDYGLLFPGKLEMLETQQNPVVGFGALGLALNARQWLQLKAQLDVNTKIIRDSRAQELGGEAAQLTLGGDILFPAWRLEIGVSEDLIIDASPDVTFHLGIANR